MRGLSAARATGGARGTNARKPDLARGLAAGLVAGLVAGTLLVMSGCGVPLQTEAESLPAGVLGTAQPTPTATRTVLPRDVYFVTAKNLQAVREPIEELTAEAVLVALADGPPVEQQAELRTLLIGPLSGAPMLAVTSSEPDGRVVLSSTEAYGQLPAFDQVLLVGQVVLSLDGIGTTSVEITDEEGKALPLPLPDGRVALQPVTPEDYASLVVD